MPESTEDKNPRPKHRLLKTVIACIVIAIVAGGLIFFINATEPKAQKSGAMRKGAALVETVEAVRGNFQPVIVSLGTVEAAREIELSPQVSGQVISVADDFIPGGFVEKGDLLLEIDPADYLNRVAMRQSELAQSLAELEQERGQQVAAKQEFALLGEEVDSSNRALILREPQIRIAEAKP